MKKVTNSYFALFLATSFIFLMAADVQADINYVNMDPPFTMHTDSNMANGIDQGGTPALGYDENFDTSYGSALSSSDGRWQHTVIVQVEFALPVRLNWISYRMSGTVGGYSDYINSYHWHVIVEIKIDDVWYQLPGSYQYGEGGQAVVSFDTGVVVYPTPIENVQGLRATVFGDSYYTGGDSYLYAHCFIHELQAWGDDPTPTPPPTAATIPASSYTGNFMMILFLSLLFLATSFQKK